MKAFASIIELGFSVKNLAQGESEAGFGANKAETTKAVLGVLSLLDPTGITNIIKAFVAPTCNFDTLNSTQITKFSAEPAKKAFLLLWF